MTRSALASSTLFHALAIWALFFFVPPGRLMKPPRAIQVALVNLPPGAFRPAEGQPVDAPAPQDEAKAVKPAPETPAPVTPPAPGAPPPEPSGEASIPGAPVPAPAPEPPAAVPPAAQP